MDAGEPAGVEFRLLGPFEVRSDGEPIPIGSPKQRSLLAMLVLSAGRVVSTDAIVDGLWGDSPPASVTSTLNSLIFRVRKVLGGAVELRTREPGYLLEVSHDQVDARCFDRLVETAEVARQDGDLHRAAQHLREALSLWRGAALADLAAEAFATAEAARLDEARLAAAEALAEIELSRGRPQAALELIEPHTADHPFRERGWAALMLAQYRLGRQAEALRTFQRLRKTLVDELGVEPTPGLRRLEDQILRHDPVLDELTGGPEGPRPEETAPGAVVSVPTSGPEGVRSNLPVPLTPLCGRQDELAELADLVGGSRLVTLTGVGGVGKTRLAIAAAERLRPAFPDGVWMVDLANLSEPGLVTTEVVAGLGLHLGLDGAAVLEERLCEHLRPQRLLLVLDNCEQVAAEVASLVRVLLGACPDVTVLATSRVVLGLTGEVTWSVPSLGVPPEDVQGAEDLAGSDAVALFCARASAARAGFGLSGANALAVARICRRLEGIPLALELAAARVRVLSAEQIAERLDDRFGLLRAAAGEVARHQTLRATMDWSYRLLTAAEQCALRSLSVFSGSFDLFAAERVIPSPADGDHDESLDAVDLVFRLVDKSMVVVVGGASTGDVVADSQVRYRLLETVREYAAERAADAGESAAAETRHLAVFLELCRTHHNRDEWWEGADWPRRISADEDNLRAALTRSLERGDQEAALVLAAPMWQYWFWMGRLDGAVWLERALAGPARPRIAARAEALSGLATFLTFGQTVDRERADALFAEAADLAAELGDPVGSARVAFLRAQLAVAQGGTEAAEAFLAQAQGGFATRDRPGTGWCEYGLGWVALAAGDEDAARAHFEQAASFVDYAEMLAPHALSSLAPLVARAGESARAVALADDAISRARRLPARLVETMTLARAGQTHLILEHDDEARRLTVELLTLQRRLGAHAWAGEALELATILLSPGQPEAAAILVGAEGALRRGRGERSSQVIAERLAASRSQLKERLGAALDGRQAEGEPLSPTAAVSFALAQLAGSVA